MSSTMPLEAAFLEIEAAVARAREAIADEHEKDLRGAMAHLYLQATAAYDLVLHW